LVHGSSPRMWGTQAAICACTEISRFIPTHVGNTKSKDKQSKPKSVHPHACGEHVFSIAFLHQSHGSSPRMWGTLKTHRGTEFPHRFIPTHVGNTAISAPPTDIYPVHPHACGEHCMDNGVHGLSNGSSPRMWGTHLWRVGK